MSLRKLLLTDVTFVRLFICVCNMCCLRWEACIISLSQMFHLYVSSPVCILICSLRYPTWINCFQQMSHLCVFTPVCNTIHCVKPWPVVNCLSQMWHWCGLSPVCFQICFLCSEGKLKMFPQMTHWYLYTSACVNMCCLKLSASIQCSPLVCVNKCESRLTAEMKCFLHMSHLCGFSFSWINLCILRSLSWANTFLQTSHSLTVCTCLCFKRLSAKMNCALHKSHLWGFSLVCFNMCFCKAF